MITSPTFSTGTARDAERLATAQRAARAVKMRRETLVYKTPQSILNEIEDPWTPAKGVCPTCHQTIPSSGECGWCD